MAQPESTVCVRKRTHSTHTVRTHMRTHVRTYVQKKNKKKLKTVFFFRNQTENFENCLHYFKKRVF